MVVVDCEEGGGEERMVRRVRVRVRGLLSEISISFVVLRYNVVKMADGGARVRQVVTHGFGVCVVCSRRGGQYCGGCYSCGRSIDRSFPTKLPASQVRRRAPDQLHHASM